jgi:hypothetical protein
MPAAARHFSRCPHGGDCKTLKLRTGVVFGILPLLFPKEQVPALPYSPNGRDHLRPEGSRGRRSSRTGAAISGREIWVLTPLPAVVPTHHPMERRADCRARELEALPDWPRRSELLRWTAMRANAVERSQSGRDGYAWAVVTEAPVREPTWRPIRLKHSYQPGPFLGHSLGQGGICV